MIVLATFCYSFGSWGLVIRPNFCSDLEHMVWSRFWSWSSGKIFKLVNILPLMFLSVNITMWQLTLIHFHWSCTKLISALVASCYSSLSTSSTTLRTMGPCTAMWGSFGKVKSVICITLYLYFSTSHIKIGIYWFIIKHDQKHLFLFPNCLSWIISTFIWPVVA